jgi:hypothetical protein
VFDKKYHADKVLRVLPYMIPVTCVYVAGEWVGYLFGPGNALARIE